MNGMTMFDAMTEIRGDIVEQAADYKFRKSPARILKPLGMAAGICIAVGAVVAGVVGLSNIKWDHWQSHSVNGTILPTTTTPPESRPDVTAVITETDDHKPTVETVTAIMSTSAGTTTAPIAEPALGETTTEPITETTVEPDSAPTIISMSFNEVINACYSVAVIRCDAVLPLEDGINGKKGAYSVTTEEILLGNDLPETFKIRNIDDSNLVLEAGKRYAVPLERSSSVFYDEDKYYISCGTVLFLDSDNNIEKITSQGSDIDIGAGVRTVDRLKQYFADNDLHCNADNGIAYTTSSDIGDVVKDSDYVLEIRIKEIQIDFVPDRTTYTVELINKYKYKNEITPDGIGNLTITVPKSSCEVGENYIVLVNSLGEGSGSFVVSSRTLSVFRSDSPEGQEIIEEISDIEE